MTGNNFRTFERVFVSQKRREEQLLQLDERTGIGIGNEIPGIVRDEQPSAESADVASFSV